jgi:hypothetical protein
MSSHPLRIGDRVTVTSDPNSHYVGTRGRLAAIDVQSDILEPYHVITGRGGLVWASTVHRSRLQYPELPYRGILVGLALVAVAVIALVGYGRHETGAQPGGWTVEYGPTEVVAPYLPPEQREEHTDRTGERVDFFAG